ncbi:MAG: hypothetical protein POELPBGB_02409 [Bacteroidia bacterium]|nr:hypothetical protein [Bacteroidia bacterium]
MPEQLKKEIELITGRLRSSVSANALFTPRGEAAIAECGAASGNIMILDNFNTPGCWYANKHLCSALGCPDDAGFEGLKNLFHYPDFYTVYGRYMAHFSNSYPGDFEDTLQLPRRDGSRQRFYIVSRVLHVFSSSGTAILSLMAPLQVEAALPRTRKGKLLSGSKAIEILEKYNKLPKEKKDTLKYLALGFKHREVASKIFRSKYSVDKYVIDLKGCFEVRNTTALVDIYRHFINKNQFAI